MFLRLLMVGVVGALGLDATDWMDMAHAMRSGCAWCAAREGTTWAAADVPAASIAPIEITPVEDEIRLVEDDPMPVGADAFAAIAEPVAKPEVAPAVVAAEPEPDATGTEDATALVAAEPIAEPVILAAANAPAPPVEDPDAGFARVVEGMVAAFGAEDATGVEAIAPEPAVSEAELIAAALEVELGAMPELVEDAADAAPAVTDAVPEAPAPSRFEEAVRLSGQALHAWLSALQAPTIAYEIEDTISR